MPNKTKNWTDVELIMSSISIAFTLGFWGLFASKQKTGADVLGQVSLVDAAGSGTAISATAMPSTLLPGQTIFFAAATPQPSTVVSSQPQPRRRGGGGGGGGGGGSVAKTGSSHP